MSGSAPGAGLRALVVLTHPPLEEGGAAGRCSIALVKGLRAHGVEVTAVAANVGSAALPTGPAALGVEVVDVDTDPSWGMRLARYADPGSVLTRGPFAARVRELARGADVVYLDEVHAAALGRTLSTPSAAHLHYLARSDRGVVAPWSQGARAGLELIRAERRVIRRTSHLVANSPAMAAALLRRGAAEVTVMPLALDPSAYGPPATLEAPVAGLIGQADWPPTADAVRRLLTRVWPRVLRRRPDAVVRLAGRGMTPEAFGGLPVLDGVEWLGRVDSAEQFLRSLGVLLYPLGRGTGTKVKVLESLALGLPVVTTTPGAEGIEPTPGVVVADADDALADAAVDVLGDAELRRRSGGQARATFALHHTPAAATRPLVELLGRLAAAGAQPAGGRRSRI